MQLTTTRFQKSKRSLKDYSHSVLKRPSSAKLGSAGRYVKKGTLKGAEVYTLTLTERETCPTSCGHWDDCYGNNMPFAHRLEHGEELEARLIREVKEKCQAAAKKGRKVLVRLHVLGDFYSVGYVEMWRKLLVLHKNLYVWGYTHVTPSDNLQIYHQLQLARDGFPERWHVRWSDTCGTFSANSETDNRRYCVSGAGRQDKSLHYLRLMLGRPCQKHHFQNALGRKTDNNVY